uniref:hypothetical protein n=1 Tax=Salmonella sp. s51933 TaxID=3160127 RepID=UPI0037549B14
EKQTTEINLEVKPRIERTTYEITHAMSPESKSVVTGKPHEISTLDFSVNDKPGDSYLLGQTTTRVYSRGNSRGNDDLNTSYGLDDDREVRTRVIKRETTTRTLEGQP